MTVTGSYFFNYTENKAESDLFRTYITEENVGYTYNEKSIVESKNINHRASLKLEWKIDSLNSILFQPRFSAQLNDGSSLLYGENMLVSDEAGVPITVQERATGGVVVVVLVRAH